MGPNLKLTPKFETPKFQYCEPKILLNTGIFKRHDQNYHQPFELSLRVLWKMPLDIDLNVPCFDEEEDQTNLNQPSCLHIQDEANHIDPFSDEDENQDEDEDEHGEDENEGQ